MPSYADASRTDRVRLQTLDHGQGKTPAAGNRPQAALQQMADNSPHVQKLARLQATLNNRASIAAQRQPANRTGLPGTLKAGIEALSGVSMDNVKVHYNSAKPARLHALAYAQGTEIHLAKGQERHLPHEAWHVVQQHQGRVKPTLQAKGVPVNDDPGLETEADVMGARALRIAAASTPTQAAAAPLPQRIVQRQQITADVTGLTHLVIPVGGSLYNGVEGPEVTDGMRLVIETNDRILSRRGPNQEVFGEADRLGNQIYTWVRVIAVGEHEATTPFYIREDAITQQLPQPPDLDASERRDRMTPPGEAGQAPPKPASLWFSAPEVTEDCKAIARSHPAIQLPSITDKQVSAFLKARVREGALEQDNTRYRGLQGFEIRLRQLIAAEPARPLDIMIGTAILAVAHKSINETFFEALERQSLFRDWYHDFAGMLAMLADRKDLSEQAIARLLKFHLMRNQVQAPYAIDAMQRTGRQTSPLLSEDYARGMRTRLWSVANDIRLIELQTMLFGSTAPHPGEKEKDYNKRIQPLKQQANAFNKAYYTVSAPAPFQINGIAPVVIDTLAVLPKDPACIYLRSLKLQLVPIRLVPKATVDSHMGGRGLRSSPSESAGIAAVAMAKLIKAGNINAALALMEPHFRPGTAKTDKTPLSRLQYDSRMLIAPREHDPITGRWRDPLLSSTGAQLRQLQTAYAHLLGTADAGGPLPTLFLANLRVFDNLIGHHVTDFFDAQTPSQVTAALTDALVAAADCVKRYRQTIPAPQSLSLVEEDPQAKFQRLADQKLCLERYYQIMQTLHEAVRFQLSWRGADPRMLQAGILHMLPRHTRRPTSTHAAPHGLGMIDQIHGALNRTDKVGVLKSAYYETPEIFGHPTIAATVEDDRLLAQDLIVLEPHPNNAEDRKVIPQDPLPLLALLAKSGRHHTVMMDVTLNHLGETEIENILKAAAPMIEAGHLNLILMQSGTKFLQHGMDISSLGIAVVFNKGKNWVEFNNKMADNPQPTTEDDSAYLGHMLLTNKDELGAYLQKIRNNTAAIKQFLADRLKPANALQITVSTDRSTVYVAIAPTDQFVAALFPRLGGADARAAAMHQAYALILQRMAALSLVGRPSFGFNLTNLGECLTTIRITPGIEDADLLLAYAEGITAVGEELARLPPAE
ncbi:MAG TPA: DUF4157 domain-containing protein [Rhodopila sp.]|nr:DUF4157 domain-containing protein [Rhodopila sp.]